MSVSATGGLAADTPGGGPAQRVVDHVLFTRFNLPSAGSESYIRAREGWLRDRVELFERYTVPSVRGQSAAGRFHWLVFFDEESPDWLLQRLRALIDDAVFTPVFGTEFSDEQLVAEARAVSGARSDMLLTTNVDNDDAIASDFVARLQSLVVPGTRTALYLGEGLILRGDRVYLHRDPHNAFRSVAEPWRGAQSVWCEWHNLLHRRMAAQTVLGGPAWLQVVHGRNVSNRVRGRLVDPRRYRAKFAVLDGVSAPSVGELMEDRLLALPVRESREVARRTVKAAIMRSGGKSTLDRIKVALQARSTR